MSSSILKFTLLIIAVLVSALFVIRIKQTPHIQQVCLNNSTCYEVELATSTQNQEKGLMNRNSLAKNRGMLFIFNREYRYGFWMKNTRIALDIIWLNKDKEVIFIKQNAQPCSNEPCDQFIPEKPALYVLELNSGQIKANNLKIGDSVEFK